MSSKSSIAKTFHYIDLVQYNMSIFCIICRLQAAPSEGDAGYHQGSRYTEY